MVKLVLTAIGDDREGLVSALSGAVAEHGGNWLDSQFARLAGKFSGVVLVELDPARSEDLGRAIVALLDTVGWRVEITPVQEPAPPGVHVPSTADPMRLHLVGQDRPGMVREVSSTLAAQHVTIDEFRSWTSAAPEGGGMLFEVDAVVRLGKDAEEGDLRDALETIAAELMVDLDLDAARVETGARG